MPQAGGVDLQRFRVDVHAARQKRGWSQADLGAHMGVTGKTVGRLERGEHMPDTATVVAAADALGLTLAAYDDVTHPVTGPSDDPGMEPSRQRMLDLIRGLPPGVPERLEQMFFDWLLSAAGRGGRESRTEADRQTR